MAVTDPDLCAAALDSKAWPFEEARKLLKRYPDGKPARDGQSAAILFETGYGPSGLPHIGTFNEVLRTTMVRNAFATLSDQPTRLIAFSDDMDGFRKVPDNVPHREMLAQHIGMPLTQVPDPFGSNESFAAVNNARLRAFLDRYGFDYEFVSSTAEYRAGRFDDGIRGVLRHYDAIMGIMLPTLRAERRATYSPVLPVSPRTGRILQVPVEVVDAEAGTIAFEDESGERVVQSALGGRAKLQWKVDWAMRWVMLGVDYEMAGKDLIDSVAQSGKIARALGGRPPEGFNYEMFLDEAGEKISKSKGNGLSIDQWLAYGPEESLAFFAYREPRKAKALHMGVIPRAIDDYWQFRAAYPGQEVKERLGNPVHHIHNGPPPPLEMPVTFGLILNLVGVLGDTVTPSQVMTYLRRLRGASDEIATDRAGDALADTSGVPPIEHELTRLIDFAIAYNRDVVAATLHRRAPVEREAEALRLLDQGLAALPEHTPPEDIQTLVYETGKALFGKENLRDWFRILYETLLGSLQGPRMGSFFALYGIDNSRKLIAEALARGAVG